MDRGGGSIGWTGMARIELMLGRRPTEEGASGTDVDESVVTLAPVKSNLGKWPRSLNMRIVEAGGSACLEVIGETDSTADDLCAQDRPHMAPKTGNAEKLIRRVLADGEWHRQREVEVAAKAAGIPDKTLKRAKKGVGVHSRQHSREWWWQLVLQEARGDVSSPLAPWPPEPDGPLISSHSRKLEKAEGHRATGPCAAQGGPLTTDGADLDNAEALA